MQSDAIQEVPEFFDHLRHLPFILYLTDCDGYIVDVTDKWAEVYGYSREMVVGQHSLSFYSKATQKKFLDAMQNVPNEERLVEDQEAEAMNHRGQTMIFSTTCTPYFDDDNEMAGFMLSSVDITEKRATEAKLFQAQKMEAIGALTSGIAHDFNNLLGVIMGNLQLLERFGKDSAQIKTRISTALDAVDKGADLTRRLLAFSKQQQLEAEPTDINELMVRLIDMLGRTLGESVSIQSRLADDVPRGITDPVQTETALLNLALNARDAMDGVGILGFRTSLVDVSEAVDGMRDDIPPGAYVSISVVDNGAGIPHENMEKVFQPFFTTKEFGKGSGLGLSMVYGFMKQTGGHVRIDSKEGVGTTVELLVPVSEDDVKAAGHTEAETTSKTSAGRVLIVEDQQDVREVAKLLIRDLGYETVQAASAQEALDMIEAHEEFDLIFTDIVMPGGMDGIHFARVVTEQYPSVPIVFTTGYSDPEVLHDAGVTSSGNLISKPYRQQEIARKFRALIETGEGEDDPDKPFASTAKGSMQSYT